MARFQSQLFNWIDNSLAAKLGRKARGWYEQIGNPLKQATESIKESIKKTTTRAILYPVYILASATKLRTKSIEVPLLLKPVQSLVIWMDQNKIFVVEKSINRSVSRSVQKSVEPNQTVKNRRTYFNGGSSTNANQVLLGYTDAPDTNSLDTNNYGKKYHRIGQLIEDAIAYFFGNKSRSQRLKSSKKSLKQKPPKSDKNKQPWLTMADVFDDHEEVWPPLDRSSIPLQIPSSNHELTINPSANIISNTSESSGTITSTTSQGLTESTVPVNETSRPMSAWIETQATFLGYVYNPFRQLVDWLDRLIANIEKNLIRLWQQLVKLVLGIK